MWLEKEEKMKGAGAGLRVQFLLASSLTPYPLKACCGQLAPVGEEGEAGGPESRPQRLLTQASAPPALPPSSWPWSLTPSWTNILWPFPPRLPGAPAWPEQTLGTCAPGLSSGKSPARGCSGQPRESGREEARPLHRGLRGLPWGLLLLLKPPASAVLGLQLPHP